MNRSETAYNGGFKYGNRCTWPKEDEGCISKGGNTGLGPKTKMLQLYGRQWNEIETQVVIVFCVHASIRVPITAMRVKPNLQPIYNCHEAQCSCVLYVLCSLRSCAIPQKASRWAHWAGKEQWNPVRQKLQLIVLSSRSSHLVILTRLYLHITYPNIKYKVDKICFFKKKTKTKR